MRRPTTVKEICDRIFHLEAEYGLLDLQVDGVKIWQYLRVAIFHLIAQACDVLDAPHPYRGGVLTRAGRGYRRLVNTLLGSPFRCQGPVDVLVFPHARTSLIDGTPIDIYSQPLIEEQQRQGRRTVVVAGRRAIGGGQATEWRCIDAIYLRGHLDRFSGRFRCSVDGMLRIDALDRLLRDSFAIDIDLRAVLRQGIERFWSELCSYRRLLARLQPTRIYLVVGYGQLAPLIRAAREAGITTVELQHGVISRYHLGYSYPGRPSLDYFPDIFTTWGSFWSSLPELPLLSKNIVNGGFPYFHKMKDRYSDVPRRKNQVLVLSQGSIGNALAELLLRAGEGGGFEGLHIIYKLHPSECGVWRDCPALRGLANCPEIELIDQEADLYRLLAESEYQVGVYSTAIFEGIGMGCKSVLVDLPGVEYMERLLERGLAVSFVEGRSLQENLRAADSVSVSSIREELFGRV